MDKKEDKQARKRRTIEKKEIEQNGWQENEMKVECDVRIWKQKGMDQRKVKT